MIITKLPDVLPWEINLHSGVKSSVIQNKSCIQVRNMRFLKPKSLLKHGKKYGKSPNHVYIYIHEINKFF